MNRGAEGLLVLFWFTVALGWPVSVESAEVQPALQEPTGTAALTEREAESLFLEYIYDRASLLQNCLFLGGVRIQGIEQDDHLATVRIRYRVECVLLEIRSAPLSRTLREDYIYRFQEGGWSLVGRAVELAPAQKGEGKTVESSPSPRRLDPRDQDRKLIVEQILAWATVDIRPPGIEEPYPDGQQLTELNPILISTKNLGSISSLVIPEREVMIMAPTALLQRAALGGEKIWVRFDLLEIEPDRARAIVSLVTPTLHRSPMGENPTNALSQLAIDFARDNQSWVLTRYRRQTE